MMDASKISADEIIRMLEDFDKQVRKSLREYKEPTVFLHKKEIEYFKQLGIIK